MGYDNDQSNVCWSSKSLSFNPILSRNFLQTRRNNFENSRLHLIKRREEKNSFIYIIN